MKKHIKFGDMLKLTPKPSPADQSPPQPRHNQEDQLDQAKDQQADQSPPQPRHNQEDQLDQAKDQQSDQKTPAESAPVADFTQPPPQISSVANTAPPAESAIQPAAELKIPAISAMVKGFLKLPNWVLDELPNTLDSNEQLLYIHLYRLSHGFGKDQCLVTLDKLCRRLQLSERTIQKTIACLETKRLIKRVGYNLGKPGAKGIIIRVENFATPANSAAHVKTATPANSADIKDLKKKLIKEYCSMVADLKKVYGDNYPISELSEDIKRACAVRGIEFDYKLFNDNLNWITKRH